MLGRATALACLAVAALALLVGEAGVADRPDVALGGATLQGDVNCSQSVDSIDSLQILRNSAGLPINADCFKEAADVNCDGAADSIDSLRILRFAAALANAPVEGCQAIGEPHAVPTFLLNELGLWPPGDEDPFAELINIGEKDASAAGLRVVTDDGVSFLAPEDEPDVPPGGVKLIKLDPLAIDGESGFVELLAGGAELDLVAWGPEQPDAVRLSRGGISGDPAHGSSIGRVPGSETRDRSEWVPYSPAQATPDAPNYLPGVEFLMPLHGAIVDAAEVPLTWYTVPNAVSYRVQVATDEGFTAPLVDAFVEEAQFRTAALAEGTHFWRVQAIFEGADDAPFSAPHQLTVDREGRVGSAGTQIVELDVPFIPQHKDTNLLLLDGPESGPHAWDVAHPGYHPNDPADNTNCALAAIVMVNRFFGGNLSQDRLGLEINTRGQEAVLATPEFGPYFDRGTHIGEVAIALEFAIGSAQLVPRKGVNDDWAFVMDAIDSGIPLVAAYTPHGQEAAAAPVGHVVNIFGYGTDGQKRYIAVNDPSVGQYALDFDLNEYRAFWGPDPEVPVSARSDEPSVHADSDGDGIMDFDETKRFKTSGTNADTDDDFISDKEEVRETVFEPRYGYAFGEGLRARYEWDDDGLHKERDCDSDNDGTLDGLDPDDFSTPPVRGSPVACSLEGVWTGEAHTVQIFGAGDMAQTRTIDATSVIFSPNEDCPSGPVECFESVAGVVHYTVSGYAAPGCTAEGQMTAEVPRGNALMTVYTNTYFVSSGYIEANIPAVMTCGNKSAEVTFQATPWLTVVDLPWPDHSVIEGEYRVGPNEAGSFHSAWRFVRQ